MDDEQEISGTRVLRLFPLSGVVFFPHSVLPLHIFEPRYRQMTEDALADDSLVTIINIATTTGWAGTPKLEEYGCVGRILRHERLPDGRYNFLLLGLKRVRLIREVETNTLYRLAEAEVVDDTIDDDADVDKLREDLVGLSRRYLDSLGGVDPDLDEVISSELPLGTLTDILAHALHFPVSMKQLLLSDPDVISRVKAIGSWLGEVLNHSSPRSSTGQGFPPPFSEN